VDCIMDAVFKKKYFWNIVCLLCSLFLMGLFLFIYFVDSEATGEVWSGVVLGGVICACSIFFLFHNFKAYLHIDAEHIKGRYNWFGRIDCTLSDVLYAQFQMNTLTILLKNGKQHIISGIENPLIPCAVLRRMMPFTVCRDIEKAKEELHQIQKERRNLLFRVILCIALMFAYIFLTVLLTGSRELYEFGKLDWFFMFLMVIAELITMVIMFFYALRTGKKNMPIERQKFVIRRSIIETSPLLPGDVKKVYADENYLGRLMVLGNPNDESIYYMIQEFDTDYRLQMVHKSETYKSIEDIPNGVDMLINITEKVLL